MTTQPSMASSPATIGRRGWIRSMRTAPSVAPAPWQASTMPQLTAPPRLCFATTAPSTKKGGNATRPRVENCATTLHSQVRDRKACHPALSWCASVPGSSTSAPDQPTRSRNRHSALTA